MLPKPPGLRSSIIRAISCRRGSAMIWGIFLTLGIMMLSVMFFEMMRLQIFGSEVTRRITTTLTSAASSRLYDSYAPIRDGTSGAYRFEGEQFTEVRDSHSFQRLYIQLHSDVTVAGGSLVKWDGSNEAYRISDIRIFIQNSEDDLYSRYWITYTLSIQQDFLWKGQTFTLTDQRQKTAYRNRFD